MSQRPLHEYTVRSARLFAWFWPPLFVAAVRSHVPRQFVIRHHDLENPPHLTAQVLMLDWSRRLDTRVGVAVHPVAGSDIEFLVAAIVKIEDARVLEEAPDDAHYADVVAHARNARAQAAESAHNERNRHAFLRRLV